MNGPQVKGAMKRTTGQQLLGHPPMVVGWLIGRAADIALCAVWFEHRSPPNIFLAAAHLHSFNNRNRRQRLRVWCSAKRPLAGICCIRLLFCGLPVLPSLPCLLVGPSSSTSSGHLPCNVRSLSSSGAAVGGILAMANVCPASLAAVRSCRPWHPLSEPRAASSPSAGSFVANATNLNNK